MLRFIAMMFLTASLVLGGYGFFVAQRVVGYLYVVPAIFLLIIALVLLLIYRTISR